MQHWSLNFLSLWRRGECGPRASLVVGNCKVAIHNNDVVVCNNVVV